MNHRYIYAWTNARQFRLVLVRIPRNDHGLGLVFFSRDVGLHGEKGKTLRHTVTAERYCRDALSGCRWLQIPSLLDIFYCYLQRSLLTASLSCCSLSFILLQIRSFSDNNAPTPRVTLRPRLHGNVSAWWRFRQANLASVFGVFTRKRFCVCCKRRRCYFRAIKMATSNSAATMDQTVNGKERNAKAKEGTVSAEDQTSRRKARTTKEGMREAKDRTRR